MTSPTNPLSPDRLDPTRAIQPTQGHEQSPSNGAFAQLMQTPATAQEAQINPSSAPSPMNILPGTHPMGGPSFDSMQSQLNIASSHIADMQAQIQTPGLKIMPQDRDLLSKHLGNATDNLRAVNTKLGVSSPPAEPLTGPLGQFMSLINDGANNIASAKQKLSSIASSTDSLNPTEMLLVQVKVNQAQQQIDFASSILSNTVNAFKTLMNLQI